MSQENVQIVRATYEAVNRGEIDTADSYIHPEIEFHTYTRSPEAGVYRSKEAVRKYNESLFGQFESFRVDVEELVDAGDRVVVVTTQHAIPKGGGQQEILVRMAEVWTVRDGLLAERHSYSTRGEALEAVGLQEQPVSQENVELTRLGYEAFNRGDIDGLLDLCAPDVEWQDPVAIDTSPATGKDAVRAFFSTVMESWQELRREPEEIIDLGDERVLVLFRTAARGKESGVEVDARAGDLLTFRQGLLVRWMAYPDRAQALEAVGLSE